MADNTDITVSGQEGLMDWEEPEEYAYEDDFLYDEFYMNEEEDAAVSSTVRQFDFSVEDTEEADEYEADEDGRPSRRFSLFGSAGKLFASHNEEDEDGEEDDEDDEPEKQRKGFSVKKLFSRKKAVEKDYDYDYDDDPDAEDAVSYEDFGEDAFYLPAEENAESSFYREEAPAAEVYYGEEHEPAYEEVYFEEEAASAYEEAYAEEEAAPAYEEAYTEEEAAPEEETESDPFAALSYRAANPRAEESYAVEDYGEEEYAEEYDEEGEYGEEEYGEEEYGEYYEDDYGEQEDYGEDSYDDFDEGSGRRASHAASGGLSRYLMPALAGVAVLALCAVAFATVTLLSSPKYPKAKKGDVSVRPTPLAVEQTAGPTASQELTQLEMQAMGMVTSDSGADSGVKAKRDADGRIVPDVGGAVTPTRSIKLGTDDFAGSTMIGNSFVEGMNLWSDIDTLKYVCADGVNLDNMIGNYLYYVTVQNYDSIYLCLGLNEIGWGADTFIRKYEKVIDYIRSDGTSKTRNATIYIVSLFPVEEIMETVPGESGSTISRSTILEFNERLKTMCEEKGCWYLDVFSALANDKGYLPEAVAADDHVHFEKTGYRIWSDYLRNHYVDEQTLGE